MKPLMAVERCLYEYATFSGRAPRAEYWWFYLFTTLLTPLLSLGADYLTLIYFSIFLTPTLAVGSRRLHDIGRSGWWQILFITVVGAIPVVYWLTRKGDPMPNRYGPIPESCA